MCNIAVVMLKKGYQRTIASPVNALQNRRTQSCRAEPPYAELCAELRAKLRAEPPYAELRAKLRAKLRADPPYAIQSTHLPFSGAFYQISWRRIE